MTNAIFDLVTIGPSLEMIAHRGFYPGDVIGVNIDRSQPCFPSGDGGVRAVAVQQLHLRRQERRPVLEIPVPVALVRALHRQCVALLALPERAFAHFDAPELVYQRDSRSGAEQRENQRTRRDVPGVVTPALEGGALVATYRNHQRKIANIRDADEAGLLIHRVEHQAAGLGGRRYHLGECLSHGLRKWRLTNEQRSVVAQQVYRASVAKIDCLIDALKLLEVDDRLHDSIEGAIRLFETPRHHDGGATLYLRDQRIAQDNAKTRMVPVRDEVRPVGKRGIIPRQLSRSKARYSMLVNDTDLAHLRQPRRSSRQPGVSGGTRYGAFVRVPCNRLARQQFDEPQAALGLLRKRFRHIPELAMGRGNGRVV